ncbi:MAG: hypothetical protein HOP30_15190 [Cyclobacteriaceae bacterium]|nr:hypothetical protein [Cyclobacteriaceae bacterium]
MRTSLFILLIALTVLFGCKDAKKSNTNLSITVVDSTAVLYSNHLAHEFSDHLEKDSFKISITGKTILTGQVKFEIKSANGEILLNETFPSYYLLGDSEYVERTDQQKEEWIKKRVDEFFNEDNFHQPAITNPKFDEDYSNKDIWEEIAVDKTAIGFFYLVGEEDGRQIAYSKKQKKVVMYFNCC